MGRVLKKMGTSTRPLAVVFKNCDIGDIEIIDALEQ